MKYALINKEAANHILKVQDSPFEKVIDSNEQVEITMSQAVLISSSEEPCFYYEGVVKTLPEMRYAHQPEAVQASIRSKRNALLVESDWTQFNDSPISEEQKTLWAEYRQQLRDITDHIATDGSVVWPTKPQ